MVSVSPPLPLGSDPADIDVWLNALPEGYGAAEAARLHAACELAAACYGAREAESGSPLMQHALGTAAILAGMGMDADSLAAALLHALPECREDWHEQVTGQLGEGVAALAGGVARMRLHAVAHGSQHAGDGQQAESLRNMLLAMVEDIRVVLIKLAERTRTMRDLARAEPAQQRRIAHEVQSIFAPLANRLGVWQLKWELEDLAMRYLEPELYRKVAGLLDERRADRERYIADTLALLEGELAQAGVDAEVSGRPKHIYSIINKMKRKHLDFSELYDVRAVRILVEDVKDCYAALGLVHNLWQPIPGEFDDYIARPKPNGYRSLHTAVAGPRGLSLEVQIRTRQMHHDSELGVAAHWRYKENRKSGSALDEKIAWLRQVLAWKSELADSAEWQEQFRNELFRDQVYVLTPQGKVIDLPDGATPVDFAYALHTDLGHRTRGAKVDGAIVPLNYRLQNGQRVEILTAKQGTPSRDWLNPALGHLHSARARAKVRHWFRMQSFDENVAQGRAQLERELQRLGLVAVNQEKLAQKLHFRAPDELYAAIGRGDVTPRQIAGALQDELPRTPVAVPSARSSGGPAQEWEVLIEGVGNLLTRMARCCNPAPPDVIVGYVTRDRGMTVHRRDCPAMLRLPEERRDRMLDAQWGAGRRSMTRGE